MPDPVVFISSTEVDLKLHRAEAGRAARDHKFGLRMMERESTGERSLDGCYALVDQADVVVVLVAYRYGWVPEDGRNPDLRSITWLECQRAWGAGKKVLGFLVDESYDWPGVTEGTRLDKERAKPGIREQVERNERLLTDFKAELNQFFRGKFTDPASVYEMVGPALADWKLHHWHPTAPSSPKPPATQDPTRYLSALRTQCQDIKAIGFQTGQKELPSFRIDHLYTPLTTVWMEPESAKPGASRSRQQRKIKEEVAGLAARVETPLEKALTQHRIVIVGEPGAGKTTFLRRIAFAAAETLLGDNPEAAREMSLPDPPPLPVLIGVGELWDFVAKRRGAGTRYPVKPDSPEWLLCFLEETSRERGWQLDRHFFETRFEQKNGALLLVDGLDEAPGREARTYMVEMMRQASQERFPHCRVAVTSRPAAYGGEVAIDGFAKAEIAPLSPEAIAVFLDKWCGLYHAADPEAARRDREALTEAVQSRIEIRQMAVNPVMLTALAVVQANEARLQDQRAKLYEAILRWLAGQRAKKLKYDEQRQTGDPLTETQFLDCMRALAFAMHTATGEKRAELEPDEAARLLAPRFRALPEDQRYTAAVEFLEREEIVSGVLIRRGARLRFWHQTFQEYLAATVVAVLEPAERNLLLFGSMGNVGKLHQPGWRETVLLLGGVLHGLRQENLDRLFEEILNRLAPSPTLAARAQCVGLMGAMLRDLKAAKYTLADARYQQHLDSVLGDSGIFSLAGQSVPFADRLEAAEALGQAGDPRLEGEHWIEIPAGKFWMGAQKTDKKWRNYDPEEYGGEGPVREVELSGYRMAKYPVTVWEYGKFMEAEGYQKREYWAAGGWEAGAAAPQFAEPGSWEEQQQHPNRPVVEVSWYEAIAYCAWKGCRLPSEAEWERAARGTNGRRYPWGEATPDARLANYSGGPEHPTPVGLYPMGESAEGLSDLAGNVYEWCSDWFGKYDPRVTMNPTGPASGESRVARGGSWCLYTQLLRASYRNRGGPIDRNGILGFRLCGGSL
ncbi:MAG: SUMF1/EgtB/PvdO family nonheme iron enzyme [Acidobacteria bacterium]|nr:SUMF1/EgtB/PvdO family nonheme iron enzyme [Acidobacteriota bacterium]